MCSTLVQSWWGWTNFFCQQIGRGTYIFNFFLLEIKTFGLGSRHWRCLFRAIAIYRSEFGSFNIFLTWGCNSNLIGPAKSWKTFFGRLWGLFLASSSLHEVGGKKIYSLSCTCKNSWKWIFPFKMSNKPLMQSISGLTTSCGHIIRDFESEAKTRCNFQFR